MTKLIAVIGNLLLSFLPCNTQTFHKQIHQFFLLLLLMVSNVLAVGQLSFAEESTPRIIGSMPRDGAEGIIRNAFIAVGFEVGDDGLGVDVETMNDSSIKLYPEQNPSSPIKSFFTSSHIPLNITIEPLHVLAPNTRYVVEITDSLKDMAGRPFAPHKITFTTGELSQPKYITMQRRKPKRIKGFRPKNDPSVLPASRTLYAEPAEEEIAISTPTDATSEEESTKPEEKIVDKSSPVPTEVKSPPTIEEAPPVASAPIGNKDLAAPPAKPKEESIDFPKARIKAGDKLPIRFVMLEQKTVKYMIKNPSGKIVKRGVSTLESGPSGKAIDISALAPGRYQIKMKVEEKLVDHIFIVLE